MTAQRIITRADPRTAPPDAQWGGRVEPALPHPRTWTGRHPEEVIHNMHRELPPIPVKAYRIVEGGGR